MATNYATKDRAEVLRNALQKLQRTTPITNIAPGSIIRALAESVTSEIGDLYAAMDFNTSMTLLSTAQGRALDLIGAIYNVRRKELGEIAAIDQSIGSFYFYIDQPFGSDITIPAGTRVFTDQENFIGDAFTYVTTKSATIAEGRTRTYAPLRPEFADSVFAAGAETLTEHDFVSPDGTTVRSTNPKPIAAQQGFESDSNYRTRIIKSIRVTNGATADALRFSGLQVPGIRDVKIRDLAYGLGTVEVVIVPEDPALENVAVTNSTPFSQARDAISSVSSVGVRLFARLPQYLACDIAGTVVLKPQANTNPQGTAGRARLGLMRYLNTLLPGDTLVYSKLLQSGLDASDVIADLSFTKLRVNAREVLRQNYQATAIEQLVPGEITISPAQ